MPPDHPRAHAGLQYWDQYARREGTWLFVRRNPLAGSATAKAYHGRVHPADSHQGSGFMQQVMKGVRVLEVAQFTFVPAAGAVLADWGADVLKVEHPVRGDGRRGVLRVSGFRSTSSTSAP